VKNACTSKQEHASAGDHAISPKIFSMIVSSASVQKGLVRANTECINSHKADEKCQNRNSTETFAGLKIRIEIIRRPRAFSVYTHGQAQPGYHLAVCYIAVSVALVFPSFPCHVHQFFFFDSVMFTRFMSSTMDHIQFIFLSTAVLHRCLLKFT
jgi:hypothetical protein